jgi:RimJ/RimL family protein N-acetyltransferase
MQPRDFAEYHLPALERDEARHNLIVSILRRLADAETAAPPPPDRPTLRRWTFGAPGECAVQAPGYPIVLGELQAAQCRAFAQETYTLDYPGVVGPDDTPRLFAEHATELGLRFGEPIPQEVQALRTAPVYPGAPGQARMVEAADAALFADWTEAFMRAAVPHDPVPSRERLEQAAGDGRYQFWIVDGEPVSMAGIMRRSRNGAAIGGVYTPPALRGRGYAGSVTAAVVERIFAEGRTMACLYADLRKPFSRRCYAKIGFQPVCRSWHCARTEALDIARRARGG